MSSKSEMVVLALSVLVRFTSLSALGATYYNNEADFLPQRQQL